MTSPLVLVVAMVAGAMTLPAHAADVKGATAPYNEAVRILDGKRVVEYPPPIPAYPNRKPPAISRFNNPQFLIEHQTGLVQCTYAMYDPGSCEPADYGTVKRHRTWVVKLNGEWQGCVGLPKPTKCEFVKPKQRTEMAIINLRPLPGEMF